ncbi:MAG: proton-conducting transporter membrane subunit [Bacteroidota bacterium]
MSLYIQLFIWLPFLGFLVSLVLPKSNEKLLSKFTISSVGIHLLLFLVFTAFWINDGFKQLDIKHIVLFNADDIEIFIDFYLDKITIVFALVGSTLMLLVAIFSRFYLHRDEGFKRFFNLLLLFFLGYNLIVFSGNFETLFIGWEILGVCSFLLISFYRDRYLPVKNALKVISVYRLGDVCLILAMWMCHHLWHQNITFAQLNNLQFVQLPLIENYGYALFIAIMLLVSASVKSAIFPFSSWLPRAMEGPTTSSAIFYGSLSVHLGAFLLLRTYPFWASFYLIKILIVILGLITAFIATNIAKVQSSVKTQIAYSSITQLGLIFIEIAVGLHSLALIHFVGNALLRTYQLLVSPSILGYKIHNMFYNFVPKSESIGSPILTKINHSLYILSVKEWGLDTFQVQYLWNPFKKLGQKLDQLPKVLLIITIALVLIIGIVSKVDDNFLTENIDKSLPYIYALVGLLLVLKALTERGMALLAWTYILFAQVFIAISVMLLDKNFIINYVIWYLGGSLIMWLIGFICLKKVAAIDHNIELSQFHGYSYETPKLGLIFIVAGLGVAGLPFTPSFIGIDVLFCHIYKTDYIFIIITALSFLFIELAILRVYARIFMGQHKKVSHATAYRSS